MTLESVCENTGDWGVFRNSFSFPSSLRFFVEAPTLQRKFPLCQVKVSFPILEVFPET